MPPAQPQPSLAPPHVVRDVTTFARALVAAARSNQMYSPQHPTAMAAAERCRATIGPVAACHGLAIGVVPGTLLVNGEAVPADPRIREASALLDDHDITQLRVVGQPSPAELRHFLALLSMDGAAVRERGGPAALWATYGHAWLQIDQIDYESLLAGPAVGGGGAGAGGDASAGARPMAVARDHVWHALVRSMNQGRSALDHAAETRLRQISRSPDAIAQLADEAAALHDDSDRATRESAQAAAMLMTFQRLVSHVERQAPHDLDATKANIADAAATMDPVLLLRMIGEAAESGVGTDVIAAIGHRFDDHQVATVLAMALEAQGKASARMAAAFSTLVPDPDRRERVLRLARGRAPDRADSAAGEIGTAWSALEKFLEGPPDAAYVSRLYGESIAQAEARSRSLRLDAPPKLPEWLRTVSAEAVRTLSTTMLLDLFALEHDPAALIDTARDLTTVAGDLLLAGDVFEAARVVRALSEVRSGPDPERAACAHDALTEMAGSAALRESAASIGDLDEREAETFERLTTLLGVGVIPTLVQTLTGRVSDVGRGRLERALLAFGDQAVAALAAAADDMDNGGGRRVIALLGRLGTARAVAALRALAEGDRPDRAHVAVHTLAGMRTPESTDVLASLLRTGRPWARVAIIDALVSNRHRAAGLLLGQLLREMDPFGEHHEIVIRLLNALKLVGTPDEVPAIAAVVRRRRLLARRQTARLRRAGLSVLAAMKSPEAASALDEAAATGDRQLRRLARAARAAGV